MEIVEKNFKSLSLLNKYQFVQEKGRFVAERTFSSFYVQLYSLGDFYVEVWRRKGLNQVNWIEIPSKKSVTDNYLQGIDIMGSLGLG